MKLVFERWGRDPRPVLLLHGFTGNRHAWSRVRPGLEPHVAALAVDLPGHGESPLPSRRRSRRASWRRWTRSPS